ncbi:molecular chaperone HtpG [Ostreibacterium oceani]|uniref:Chaperone protein HtpG n=1 Tax=Ostreibacterium oceani TaxID=2654998 RepID=A0A6N7EYG4_9GAMM|nr:molecular chaperone HtpG [Ostreibacterium oceani]MPV85518.1 molecular chaperone HtpG [Ostreibacterium oceani]
MSTTEKMGFQTEVSQLLHLVTHSLYSNKEIFLRELISNASDAIDKLKFVALSDNNLYENDSDLKIQIRFDETANTLTISDNGIGMNRQELIDNLGTIAKSGTKAFFEQLSGDAGKDSELIGQFGVGFYSAFIVADKVTVNTRKAGESEAHQWVSDGHSDFEISTSDKASRGTDIVLHLKSSETQFTNRWQLQQIITKYSDHISVPVELWQDAIAEEKDEDGNITVAAQAGKFEQINRAKALWLRNKSDISDEEYQTFYKHISHDFQDAATWTHNKVEGKLEYTSLLFVPQKAPFDLFQRDSKRGLKLFVQRVFIMDDAEQFLPHYLRFIKGVIDSNDLPLNVSREILQDGAVTQSLRKACTKRALDMMGRLAEDNEKYANFWQEFGNTLKEGIGEDFANRENLFKLLRFASTQDETGNPTTALADYVARMPEKQEKIYYLIADSQTAAKHSPHLEIFAKNGIEVLLMWEPIDEWMMGQLHEFEGKPFEAINQTDISGELFQTESDETDDSDSDKDQYQTLIENIKTTLGDHVVDVRISKRLTKTPTCVVLESGALSNQMQRIMKAAGQAVPKQRYIFEINTDHPLIQQLSTVSESQFADWVTVLFDQALLAENGNLDDAATFISKMNGLLLAGE